MTSNRQEGQTFAQLYSLHQRVSEQTSSDVEAWVATRIDTGDRVFLKILDSDFEESLWQSVVSRINSLKGLLHENISLITDYGVDDGAYYLAEPYIAGGQFYEPVTDNAWPVLSQLLDAIIYAHNLGIAHGNLHPANLILDPAGTLKVTGFGTGRDISRNSDEQDYLSPQVNSGATADVSDDVFSLGCIVFQSLTGKKWTPGVELDTPLPPAVHGMVTRMLSSTAVDRQMSLAEVRDSLRSEFEDKSAGITSVSFSRAADSQPDVMSDPMPAAPIGSKGKAVPMQTVLLAGAGLVIFGLLLFLFLPQTPGNGTIGAQDAQVATSDDPSGPTAAASSPAAAPTLTPREKAALEFQEKEGERVAREILRLQLELEDLGINLWAAETYDELNLALDSADELYRGRSFAEALSAYEEVLVSLQNLLDQSSAVLTDQSALGDAALATGDAETALTAFTIATVIDRDDPSLQNKLARAANLEEVLFLVQQAEATERNGDLDGASQLFKQARDLDSLWPPAENGYRRVREAITLRQFQAAMSEGFQAISDKNYAAAREGFAKAQSILPGSNEPSDGLLQIEQAERNDLMLEHRKLADEYIKASDWPAAIKEYEAALAITPNMEFALNGLAKAQRRLEIDQEINRFLSDPTLLQSDDNLSAASDLLRDASRLPDTDINLGRRINGLAQLVSTARIEIPVTIVSDGKTDITVRRHKALGSVTSEVVYLIPGRWAIVGVRPGYQDVRHDLVLVAGRPVPEINIASTERIR